MIRLHFIQQQPSGSSTGTVLLRGGLRQLTTPVYQVSAEARELRARRQASPLVGLREMALRLGLTATQLSTLETGQSTIPADEWRLLLEAVGLAKR